MEETNCSKSFQEKMNTSSAERNSRRSAGLNFFSDVVTLLEGKHVEQRSYCLTSIIEARRRKRELYLDASGLIHRFINENSVPNVKHLSSPSPCVVYDFTSDEARSLGFSLFF
jgi:hypothetical protein